MAKGINLNKIVVAKSATTSDQSYVSPSNLNTAFV